VFRAPLDLAPAVGRTLESLRPSLLVLECLELWPTLVSACARRGVPVAVVNGRMSGRSLSRYEVAGWLFRPCFRALSLVTALTDEDAGRFVRAGVPPARVVVEPSSKHGELPLGRRMGEGAPRLVLGSIHRQEEAVLLPWLPRLVRGIPGLSVVVAPRYPSRAGHLRRRLAGLGLDVAFEGHPAPVTVLTCMGRLARHYRGATVAFVGGSLVPRGGHNLVEAAAAGAAVLAGPHLAHCRREAELLVREGAAAVVCDGGSFCHHAEGLLRRPRRARRMGERGREVAAGLSRSADRIAARLIRLLRDREAEVAR
jgi:3-deoxy-D-manno-octulosonic-acid transferase